MQIPNKYLVTAFAGVAMLALAGCKNNENPGIDDVTHQNMDGRATLAQYALDSDGHDYTVSEFMQPGVPGQLCLQIYRNRHSAGSAIACFSKSADGLSYGENDGPAIHARYRIGNTNRQYKTTEFSPVGDTDTSCILVQADNDGRIAMLACVPRGAPQDQAVQDYATVRKSTAQYEIDNGRTSFTISVFNPVSAPNTVCSLSRPDRSNAGSSLSCTAVPQGGDRGAAIRIAP